MTGFWIQQLAKKGMVERNMAARVILSLRPPPHHIPRSAHCFTPICSLRITPHLPPSGLDILIITNSHLDSVSDSPVAASLSPRQPSRSYMGRNRNARRKQQPDADNNEQSQALSLLIDFEYSDPPVENAAAYVGGLNDAEDVGGDVRS